MDLHDPKVIIGGAALGGALLYFFLRAPAAASDTAVAPSLISYVSPGDKDAVVSGSASTTSASDGTASALVDANKSTNDTNLSVLNTESLLTNISSLVNSQVSKLPFKTDYGFSSSVTGAIALDKAGAPSFTFQSSFAPKDASVATSQIASLTKQVAGWKQRYNDAIAKAKEAAKPKVKKP